MHPGGPGGTAEYFQTTGTKLRGFTSTPLVCTVSCALLAEQSRSLIFRTRRGEHMLKPSMMLGWLRAWVGTRTGYLTDSSVPGMATSQNSTLRAWVRDARASLTLVVVPGP